MKYTYIEYAGARGDVTGGRHIGSSGGRDGTDDLTVAKSVIEVDCECDQSHLDELRPGESEITKTAFETRVKELTDYNASLAIAALKMEQTAAQKLVKDTEAYITKLAADTKMSDGERHVLLRMADRELVAATAALDRSERGLARS